jgi:hypothetical protein
MPRGFDVGRTYAVTDTRGSYILYDRARCTNLSTGSDIYRFNGIPQDRVEASEPPPRRYILTAGLDGQGDGRVTSDKPGIDCAGDCIQGYDEGTVVTLTAEPGTASHFTGWSGDCSGTSPTCTLRMTQDRHAVANFDLGP